MRRLAGAMPPEPELVTAHGDFHRAQLLRVQGRLVVLDVDAMCLAAPALDVAEYASGAVDGDEAGWEAAEAVLDGLLEAYGSRPAGLEWHLANALVVRASHPFHRLLPSWPDRIEAMLGIAETALAHGRRP